MRAPYRSLLCLQNHQTLVRGSKEPKERTRCQEALKVHFDFAAKVSSVKGQTQALCW